MIICKLKYRQLSEENPARYYRGSSRCHVYMIKIIAILLKLPKFFNITTALINRLDALILGNPVCWNYFTQSSNEGLRPLNVLLIGHCSLKDHILKMNKNDVDFLSFGRKDN